MRYPPPLAPGWSQPSSDTDADAPLSDIASVGTTGNQLVRTTGNQLQPQNPTVSEPQLLLCWHRICAEPPPGPPRNCSPTWPRAARTRPATTSPQSSPSCSSPAAASAPPRSPRGECGLPSDTMALITSGCGSSGGNAWDSLEFGAGAIARAASPVSHGLQLQSPWVVPAAAVSGGNGRWRETVILPTLSLSVPVETPTNGREGCSSVTLSPTAQAASPEPHVAAEVSPLGLVAPLRSAAVPIATG